MASERKGKGPAIKRETGSWAYALRPPQQPCLRFW
jgi:hypothetical protein